MANSGARRTGQEKERGTLKEGDVVKKMDGEYGNRHYKNVKSDAVDTGGRDLGFHL